MSPLVGRIEHVRNDILQRAQESGWVVDEGQLSDQAIVRRMVLKRCIYGVDKNPMAVELAKVSLWLHSFTVGAPLSFLDHHLRCGDSLVGTPVAEAAHELNRLGGLFTHQAVPGAEAATRAMQQVEAIPDTDIAEVQQSAGLFDQAEAATADLRAVLDVLTGLRWLTAGMRTRERAAFEAPLVEPLGRHSHEAFELLAHGPSALGEEAAGEDPDVWDAFQQLRGEAQEIAVSERFLHWQAAFPGVWEHWQHNESRGGFDAVIGNPPWDRIKHQEVEWFATRDPELARAPTAAARRAAILELRQHGDPLAAEFDAAKQQADTLGQLVRESGRYPLLGGGDINLYSLFVEQALSLVKPDGFVSLLTPSGIYADRTAARFFQTVSTTGRLASLYDFENRRIFFKDVRASFKFCALTLGGEKRRFDQTRCAFFLHDTDTIKNPDRLRRNPPPEFADWVWDSRRALAIQGEDENFRRGMVAAYKRTTESMPRNGIQVIMFTHQSGAIWADMANIVWAAGLQVTAAWYVVTETGSALRDGSNVKGTVLLVCRKRAGDHKITRDDLAWEIQEEVDAQVQALTGLNQQARGLYRDENVFEDADVQMAGYAAALRALTRYARINGRDMASEAIRPRVKNEITFVDELIAFAVNTANQSLVPQGIEDALWKKLSGAERFYLKMLDLEARGAKTLDNYQNFAKAFKVRDFYALMGDRRANHARLKAAAEFGRAEMGEGSELHGSVLRAVLYALMELLAEVDTTEVLAHLTHNVPDYYTDLTQRKRAIALADYLAGHLETIRPDEASAARVLAEALRNQRVG